MLIRDAEEADLIGILAIYNDAVATTTAILNYDLVDLDDRRLWFEDRRSRGFPVLIAVEDGAVLGYASFGPWRPFDGFLHTVEHSIYVHRGAHRRGIASALMKRLIDRARASGRHVMIAGIEGSNAGSLALHARLGFQEVGRHKEAGTKFGRWLDLVFLQLQLDDGSPADRPGIADPGKRSAAQ